MTSSLNNYCTLDSAGHDAQAYLKRRMACAKPPFVRCLYRIESTGFDSLI